MELYHVLNRGVDKRDIFMDASDYLRFVHDMWEFNDIAPTQHAHHSFKNLDLRNPNFTEKNAGTAIVDIHGWCLMKNHYHLLLSERVEGGLTKFLRKLNVGYANYFNERHEREGSLFQGRTKRVLIERDAHFMHILHYIHFNPLDFVSTASGWREHAIEKITDAKRQLELYRWSSYHDYCGKKNFPSILTRDLFSDSSVQFEREALAYLRDMTTADMTHMILE
ncbi:hypothetical protein FJY93_05035 [Candidatus Kaiserbacteria bacterium]|nr:hypothetical protein [Candidatus Kaiserbacteria bacterium]